MNALANVTQQKSMEVKAAPKKKVMSPETKVGIATALESPMGSKKRPIDQ